MRNIDENIWRDDWFAEQEPIGKLIWIGILTKVADDQGRFRHNSDLVKSDLFPMSKTPTSDDVDKWVIWFVTSGKLVSYEINGKRYLQVRNWWKYQGDSAWMGASHFPPPEGWQDCWRYHSKGNVIMKSPNWEGKQAGFIELPIALPSELPSSDINSNSDNDSEVEEGGEHREPKPVTTTTAAFSASQYFTNIGYSGANRLLCDAAGLAAIPGTNTTYLDTVASLITQYGEAETKAALIRAKNKWITTPRKQGGGMYSVLNFGWVDWAMAELSGQPNDKQYQKPVADPFGPLTSYLQSKAGD